MSGIRKIKSDLLFMNEFINSKPKSLVSNSFWSFFLTVWQIAVTFFLTPFLISKLGLEYYGLLILLLTIGGMMSIMSFGLGDSTLRYVAYYYGKNDIDGINRVVNTTFTMYIGIGILSFSIVYFNAQSIVELLTNDYTNILLMVELVELIAYSISLGFIGSAFGSIPQALQRYDISTKINIMHSILYVIGTVVILLNDQGIKELIIWNIYNILILQFINLFIAKNLIKNLKLFPKFDIKTFKEIYGFSFFTFLTHFFALIQHNSDKLLTSIMINATSLTYLSVPQQISFKGSQAIESIGKVLLPKFSSMTEKDEKKQLFLDSTWFLLIISASIFVPLTILLPDFLTLWINEEFSKNSAWLAQIIAASFIVRGSFSSYASLFNGMGKAKYISVTIFITGFTSLIVNFALISMFGFYGLGYAYWITPIVGISAILFTWYYIFKETKILPILQIFIMPSIVIFISFFILNLFLKLFIIDNWFILIVIGIFISLAIALVLIITEYFMENDSRRLNYIWKLIKA